MDYGHLYLYETNFNDVSDVRKGAQRMPLCNPTRGPFRA